MPSSQGEQGSARRLGLLEQQGLDGVDPAVGQVHQGCRCSCSARSRSARETRTSLVAWAIAVRAGTDW